MSDLISRLADLSPKQREVLLKKFNHRKAEQLNSQAIVRQSRDTVYFPLSFAQQRLWFFDQIEPGSPRYNVPDAIRLKGKLNVTALKQSLNEIVRRHEIFRTTFTMVNGEPMQVIQPTLTLTLPVVDLRAIPETEREAEAIRMAVEDGQQPFDLSQGPLLRFTLVWLDEDDYLFLRAMHHMGSDMWSRYVFTQELVALYEAFSKGQPSPLPALPLQYVDFAVWQRQQLVGEMLETHLAYWKKQLGGNLSVLKLPTDRPRPPIQTARGKRKIERLPKTLANALKALSQHEGVTLFMILQAAFNTLLYRYTDQEDILVGSPIANRNKVETEGLIGFLVNTLVLRTNLSGNPSFRELLGRVREVTLGAYDHQDLPFEKLVEDLQPERDLSFNPLFQVVFALQNAPIPPLKMTDLTLTYVNLDYENAVFDLALFLWETLEIEDADGGLTALYVYNTDLFDAATINRMAGHFKTLLESIVANPDQAISELPLFSEAERHQQLVEWNNTQTNYPDNKCIHELFEAQVERTPDAVAVVFQDQRLSYKELNRRANQLAHHLQTLGVRPEIRVGLCLERSLEMIVGLFGILKAGGAYVPLDPTYPKERLALMIKDAQVALLLTQKQLAALLPKHETQSVYLDSDWDLIAQQREVNPVNLATADNLAYIVYTSGSTGRPKGVMIQHRSVLNLLSGLEQSIYADHHHSQLQVSLNGSLTFDTSVKQVVELLHGHTLQILPQEIRFDGNALLSYLQHQKLDVFDCTPSQLGLLMELGLLSQPGHVLKHVLVGGEAVNESTWQVLTQSTNTNFYNVYGPTECTVDTTVCCLQMAPAKPTIGRPIANTQIYLLNRHLQLVPIGVSSELYISGIGLARGYLNHPELTAEKFIPNPFSNEPGSRLYKTGDIGRYLPDGNIEFLGRIDNQVKIRGFRIELQEIEAVLEQYPAVRKALVLDREEPSGNKRLVAYVVPKQKYAPTIAGQQRYKLPNNMAVVHLNKNETDFLYKEVFEVQAYLKHGITINNDDCIFDVGANIGLFTVFAHQRCKNGMIYAFEPNPFVFEKLRLNTLLYEVKSKLFDCALSSEARKASFTFYPKFSFLSGLYADTTEEKDVVKSFIRIHQRDDLDAMSFLNQHPDDILEELLEDKFESQTFTVQLRTISDIIRENNIERIDLLKINVEKSESDVIAGIGENDWKKIKQIVMELHDIGGRLEQITTLLKNHNFNILVEQDWSLEKNKNVYYIYAIQGGCNDKLSNTNQKEKFEQFLEEFSEPILSTNELHNFLKEKLTDYMMPSAFVLLESLPLTPNGKVDRQALPAPNQTRPELDKTFVAPRNDVENLLAATWAEVLGVERISIHDNFFELGGHSLLAVQVMLKINQKLGINLPVNIMFQSFTVAGLASAITNNTCICSLYSCLVPIRVEGTQPTLFCIHPAGGQVIIYQHLVAGLSSDQPVYALQSRALNDPEHEHDSIEKMAVEYANAIRQHQPEGPYYLTGWSMGGVLAVSVAKELENKGQRVAFVGLLDAYLFKNNPSHSSEEDPLLALALVFGGTFADAFNALDHVEKLALRNELLGLSSLERLQRAVVWGQKQSLLSTEISLDILQKQVILAEIHEKMLKTHDAPVIQAPLHIWWAAERRQSGRSRTDWSQYTMGGIYSDTASGNHFTLIRPPHLKTLAQRLQECLRAACSS